MTSVKNDPHRRLISRSTEFQCGSGELGYAEADASAGPRGPGLKVLTHEYRTFHGSRIDTKFTTADPPTQFFVGCNARDFADQPQPTPRCECRRRIYRIDLHDSAPEATLK